MRGSPGNHPSALPRLIPDDPPCVPSPAATAPRPSSASTGAASAGHGRTGGGGLPAATIVFTTHNRRALLRRAIAAALDQTVPLEILVMDDASADGTREMMEAEFPSIAYRRSTHNMGPCFHRNRGIALALADVVFPLDDDSILQSPCTVEQTLREFSDPRVAAVAVPFVNVLQTARVESKAPDEESLYVTSAFVAAAHAIRKDAFARVGGYREDFFYMGEESDLCIRLLERGLVVRLGCADPIAHYQPPGRVSLAADFYGRRNDILFLYYNAPARYLVPLVAGTTAKGLLFGASVGRIGNMTRGLAGGYQHALRRRGARKPVRAACFRCFRQLKRAHSVRIVDIDWYIRQHPMSPCGSRT
jgi:GT2 family glycosyltransferase